MKLSADMVVLSGCETALGKYVNGEGLIGLTRGFMYAGAQRVAASVWRVDDLATAELMRKFYTAMLRDKMQPVASLRAAQLAMLNEKGYGSPYYWASFLLYGN